MTSSIVCGIDASAHARAALEVAAALAERLKLRLVLVHAVPAPTPDLLLAPPARVPANVKEIDLIGHDAGAALVAQAAEAHHVPGGERRLEDGHPAERLCALAHHEQAEFVVVGSRGTGALRAAILGSVSVAVARDAPCPVVVVPPGMAGPPLAGERILCGVHNGEDGPAAATATRLSDRLNVPLTLAHILPATPHAAEPVPIGALPATYDERLDTTPRRAPHSVHGLLDRAQRDADRELDDVQLRRGDPADELLDLATSTRAILLVVGSRGLGPLRGGLLGSVSRELVRRSTRPVVICRHEAPT